MVILAFGFISLNRSSSEPAKKEKKEDAELRQKFNAFKLNYFLLYVVLMLSDWVQGTNMYTLYQGYGVDIGTLFLTGFGASGVFSLFLGPFIDQYGRKKACILYCVGEVVINIMEHSHDFHILLIGRVIGGLTTALLFTAFESWMVSSHREKGFKEEWLAETFSMCSVGNGVVAILAGLISQVMADWMGDIGPFRLAVALSFGVGVVIAATWEENYGDQSGDASTTGGIAAVRSIVAKPEIFLVGAIQAIFQGAMFTFVFMWVPVMFSVAPNGQVPTGLVYASLMAAIAIGGCILSHIQKLGDAGPSDETIGVGLFAVAAVSMAVPALYPTLYPTLFAFLVFEACVGVYDGVSGLTRSKYIPDNQMGAIMNVFRVPLNILVVVGTKMESTFPHSTVFLYCAVCHVLTLLAAIWLRSLSATSVATKQRGKKASEKKKA